MGDLSPPKPSKDLDIWVAYLYGSSCELGCRIGIILNGLYKEVWEQCPLLKLWGSNNQTKYEAIIA